VKCLMPLNQRKVIAEAIDGKRYCEWGCGGTTLWLAEHARPDVAYSVEHVKAWADDVHSGVGVFDAEWTIVFQPCQPGQNATIGEESAVGERAYIGAGMRVNADVYLIDGVVRAKCLRRLLKWDQPLTIFIHDTQRDWYDDAIAKAIAAGFERTDYPEGDDYPGCLLTKLEKK